MAQLTHCSQSILIFIEMLQSQALRFEAAAERLDTVAGTVAGQMAPDNLLM